MNRGKTIIRTRKTWASWNCFKTNISEEKLKARADALIETGLAEYGYTHLNIDDGFFGRRAADGTLLFHKEQYTKIGNIINEISERTSRPIVYNVCRWQFPGKLVTEIAVSCRTCADIQPNFASILKQIDAIKLLAWYCSLGHVNRWTF